jgi:hypothetical protein
VCSSDLVSGAAVAVSLIFLLLQMRQNDKTLRATMQQSRTARYSEQILRPTEPYLCEAVTRAQQADLTLDSSMVNAFIRHAANIFWNSEDVFLQYKSGTVDRVTFDSDITILSKFLSAPAYRVAWKMNRDFTTGEFRVFVDKLISETKSEPIPDRAVQWRALMTAELSGASA